MRSIVSILCLHLVVGQDVFEPSDGVEKATINVDGLQRTYYTQYPTGTMPKAGWPVIFGFHGWCGSASSQVVVLLFGKADTRHYARTATLPQGDGGEGDGESNDSIILIREMCGHHWYAVDTSHCVSGAGADTQTFRTFRQTILISSAVHISIDEVGVRDTKETLDGEV